MNESDNNLNTGNDATQDRDVRNESMLDPSDSGVGSVVPADMQTDDIVDESIPHAVDPSEIPTDEERHEQEKQAALDAASLPPAKNVPPAPKDQTRKNSSGRLMNNGKLRFIAAGGIATVLLVGIAGYNIIQSANTPPPDTVAGEVTVPVSSAKASATVTAEQAVYLQAQYDKNAAEAAARGESYIPPPITVGAEPEQEELGAPSQPGMVGNSAIAANNAPKQFFYDPSGNKYSVDDAYALQTQNRAVEGVTVGYGSIVDPNVNVASKSIAPALAVPLAATTTTAAGATAPATPAYVITPYQSASATSANGGSNSGSNSGSTGTSSPVSESTAAQLEAVDKAKADVDAWTQSYVALRQKKAELVDQKAQNAFESQLERLGSVLNPPKKANTNKGVDGYNRIHYNDPKPLNQQYSPSGTVGNLTTPTQISNSNGLVGGAATDGASKPLIRAGETHRAILVSQVNTDQGTDILARVVSGPLKGATVQGTASITNSNMQFNFSRAFRKNQPELGISAQARQLGTNALGMADSINKHYIKRYSALVATSVLSGVGQAYEQTAGANAATSPNGTVVTQASEPSDSRILGNAAAEAGNQLSAELSKTTAIPATYITEAGKVFNLFFTQDVADNSAAASRK